MICGHRYVDHTVSMFGEGRALTTGAPVPVTEGIEPITQDEATLGGEVALTQTMRARMWLQGRWMRRAIETVGGRLDNPQGEPAERETGLFAAEVATAPTARLVLRAGYMYGRTVGAWTGPYDPRQGAILYAGTDFDFRSANGFGRLPTDMGHRAYIEAERA